MRRHNHSKRGSVYAYAQELDAWWNNRRPRLEQEPEALQVPTWRLPALASRTWLLAGLGAVGVAVLALALARWAGTRPQAEPQLSSALFPTQTFDGVRPRAELSGGIIGDVNGDGLGDVVFSAGDAREVYVLFGTAQRRAGGELPEVADVLITTELQGPLWATQIGDCNGDGMDDLLASHLQAEPEQLHVPSKSYIVWGRASWPKKLALPKTPALCSTPSCRMSGGSAARISPARAI